jgi:hypothetical protein
MTDKERLERIKQNDLLRIINDIILYGPKGIRIESVIKDIEWLINRVEKLEMRLSINTNNMKQLQKENERYKQALEKIVNYSGINKEIDLELWEMARQALKGESQ